MPKHILNTPKSLVQDGLTGLTFLNPNITYDSTTNVVALREVPKDQVSLVAGGGSGHEPAHASYVGSGMLSAAVAGQTFASPNARQVEAALERLSFSKGTLIIVKNYTGDVLQFGLAKERWSATHLGKDDVRLVVVGDDVSVPRSQGKLTGRRGLAGTTLVHKIAGALAATGAELDDVEHVAQLVAENSGTFGVGLEHCHVPGTEEGEAYLKADELEMGMGIHNEPGIRKVSPIPAAERLVNELLTTLTTTEDKERSYLPFKNDGKDEVVLMVNNLGGLAEIELAVIVKEASQWLAAKRISVQRVISGSFMASLSLPGFSITVLLLPRESKAPTSYETKLSFDKDFLLELFDAPTDAPGWRWAAKQAPESHVVEEKERTSKADAEAVKGPAPVDAKMFLDAIKNALKHVIAAEPEITKYDQIAGDGDAGVTLKQGAEGIEGKLGTSELSDKDVVAAMVCISEVVETEMGGTSGGLYSIFFSALSKGLLEAAKEKSSDRATAEVWARGLELALNVLYTYTRARPPSRTLVDPLGAFIGTFSSDPANFAGAFKAAQEAAEATRDLDATAGRAAYVDQAALEKAKVPDAGAWGVLKILEGIKEVIGKA